MKKPIQSTDLYSPRSSIWSGILLYTIYTENNLDNGTSKTDDNTHCQNYISPIQN